ncbi:Uncharacterised protein [BD1-7 clade bacterium]|uniref:Uncharacterized protein n=1 Tax=BD1-7 clade bacterium TaxID=2029982 RepID=A0A5S9QYI1_9GAMM|nr:Uncharacterised protein [BD1-7 clade bacterium]
MVKQVLRSAVIATLMVFAPVLFAEEASSTAGAAVSDVVLITEATYSLGVNDKIEIVVFGEDDLSVERRIDSRGVIHYPLIGAIKFKGLTVQQAAEKLEDALRGDYLISPQVNVSILEYRQVFVRGEVKQPGGFPFIPGLTVGKAVALAGGFTERASRKKIDVSREQEDGVRADVTGDIKFFVQPGDVLIVNESFF